MPTSCCTRRSTRSRPGDADEDVPWIGPELRPDMRAAGVASRLVGRRARRRRTRKVTARASSRPPRRSRAREFRCAARLMVGPRRGRDADEPAQRAERDRVTTPVRATAARSCSSRASYPDFAIIAKPGWTVDWEEVGLCWFRFTVRGRLLLRREPAPDRVQEPDRRRRDADRRRSRRGSRSTPDANASGLVAPQANIGHIEGGWARTASLSPAACTIDVDVRVQPAHDAGRGQASGAGRRCRRSVAANPGSTSSWEMTLSIPGTSHAAGVVRRASMRPRVADDRGPARTRVPGARAVRPTPTSCADGASRRRAWACRSCAIPTVARSTSRWA